MIRGSELSDSLTGFQAVVHGRVQGVGYRNFVYERARALKLHGFVMNRTDGSVCVVASGGRDALRDFLVALRKGPFVARVDDMLVDWGSPVVPPGDFEIRT